MLLPGSAAEPLGAPKYWPIYARRDRGGGLVVHTAAATSTTAAAGYPSFYLDYHVGNGDRAQASSRAMVAGGLFEAVPGVRVVSPSRASPGRRRCAGRWTPPGSRCAADHPRLTRRPSEYIDEHVWFTTQPIEEPADPQHLLYAIEQAHLRDRLLFSTDYPHWDFDSPSRRCRGSSTRSCASKILCGNALRPLRLPGNPASAATRRNPSAMSAAQL